MKQQELSQTWDTYLTDRDDESKNKLVEHYFDFVNKIAFRLSRKLNNHVSSSELASHGVDGLYRAIERFDMTRGNKFETYAYIRIRGSMLDGLRKEDWVPRSVRVRQSNIEKERHNLENKYGKKMAEADILKRLDINEEEYNSNIGKFKAKSVSSIEACLNPDIDDSDNKKDFNMYLEAHNCAAPDGEVLRKEFLNKLIGKRFTNLERKIVYYYYYRDLTMKEIAEELEISESRISQMYHNILKRLKIRIKVNPSYFGDEILSIIERCNSNDSLF